MDRWYGARQPTCKWRRKSLKNLETDLQMAPEGRSAELPDRSLHRRTLRGLLAKPARAFSVMGLARLAGDGRAEAEERQVPPVLQ